MNREKVVIYHENNSISVIDASAVRVNLNLGLVEVKNAKMDFRTANQPFLCVKCKAELNGKECCNIERI